MHTGFVATVPIDDANDKRLRILDAAEQAFSAYGFARSSMADIASGADMSRPALYQHFANKEEILTAVLGRLLDTAADAAIGELEASDELTTALDGFLQRWTGDLTERFRATQHGADLVEAKHGNARTRIAAIRTRVRNAVVDRIAQDNPDRASELADLLLLAPVGLKSDDPPMDELRNRLRHLAAAVAGSA